MHDKHTSSHHSFPPDLPREEHHDEGMRLQRLSIASYQTIKLRHCLTDEGLDFSFCLYVLLRRTDTIVFPTQIVSGMMQMELLELLG